MMCQDGISSFTSMAPDPTAAHARQCYSLHPRCNIHVYCVEGFLSQRQQSSKSSEGQSTTVFTSASSQPSCIPCPFSGACWPALLGK